MPDPMVPSMVPSTPWFPPNYTTPSYRIRDMHRWAVANGKDVEKLTPAEREQFIVKPKKQAL